ncbi:hypothetical protein ONE63_000857 [Megalurothrips usitatus]|uniref:Uncharacterized protein n=1 Tax=Megalurothrips usitatus TaxID=439358 RepID=A0AAV7XZS6_9NEOP|nr:hypothetical protein ONE63_000857 [Megalurothrips usitatus]
MEVGDVSLMSDCDFALNDGEVTVVGDVTVVGEPIAKHLKDAKQDGSDSGVELNGAERSASPALCTPVGTPGAGPPPHLDYDGTSEGTRLPGSAGGSESSSVLSHTPVRKKASSTSSSASCSTPGRQGGGGGSLHDAHVRHAHPRSRSVAAASAPVPAPRPRERSAAGRGSSCTRGRQAGGADAPPAGSARTLTRAQRSASGAGSLMTSSLTGSLTLGASGSNNVRGRGPTRTSTAPRPAPRGAAPVATSTDDGRWPSTVQRPTTLSRTRASSVAADRDRERARHGVAGLTLTSSSSKNSVNSTNSASTPSPTVESKSEKFSTLPRRRRRRSVESIERTSAASAAQSSRKAKVTLYHETGAQTALTLQDLDDVLGGRACQLKAVDAKEQSHQGVQVDRERDDFASHLLDRRLRAIIDMLGFEHSGTPRSPGRSAVSDLVLAPAPLLLPAWLKSLELLEQRAATIKKRDAVQRNEIGRLRYEVEHIDRLRKRLQSQQEETEAETVELQEFLQVEKSMLAESLKEAEKEIQAQKKISEGLNEELERQRDECQHLVRMSEQRRQEVLTLQARVAALEQRSKESLLQQGAAVSGASVALSALSSRLDDLALQLEESPVDKALSTLSTEAEAVTTRTKEACRPLSIHLENVFQTLDNVTEPELEEEGGGQRDSVISESSDTARLANSESIQNLSAAILYRRMQEEAIKTESYTSDEVPGHLVDQVLDVDSLVTRVLRAISEAVHTKKHF